MLLIGLLFISEQNKWDGIDNVNFYGTLSALKQRKPVIWQFSRENSWKSIWKGEIRLQPSPVFCNTIVWRKKDSEAIYFYFVFFLQELLAFLWDVASRRAVQYT